MPGVACTKVGQCMSNQCILYMTYTWYLMELFSDEKKLGISRSYGWNNKKHVCKNKQLGLGIWEIISRQSCGQYKSGLMGISTLIDLYFVCMEVTYCSVCCTVLPIILTRNAVCFQNPEINFTYHELSWDPLMSVTERSVESLEPWTSTGLQGLEYKRRLKICNRNGQWYQWQI